MAEVQHPFSVHLNYDGFIIAGAMAEGVVTETEQADAVIAAVLRAAADEIETSGRFAWLARDIHAKGQ